MFHLNYENGRSNNYQIPYQIEYYMQSVVSIVVQELLILFCKQNPSGLGKSLIWG